MTSEPSSFAFIPRAVKKKNCPSVSSHTPSKSISIGAQVTSESTLPHRVKRTKDIASSSEFHSNKTTFEDDDDEHAADTKTKPTTATSIATRKDLLDLEDLAQLVCLALSDYAVWADVDLRRKIDWGFENDQGFYDDDTELVHDTPMDDDSKGYIPLAYLLRHSQVFRLASSSSSIISQPQTTFIKAIRTHASHLIDVRLIIPSSSSSTFPRNKTTQWIQPHIQTGYELRRKEVPSALGKHGKKEWDALTIYVENIPNQYRSIPGITRFVNGLLPPSPLLSIPSALRIQNISLPSHHQDQPNTVPTCKGFALVTLSHDDDVNALLKTWCWDHPTDAMNSCRPPKFDTSSTIINIKGKEKDKECPDEEISLLAVKFGLRVLTKAKWEELRAEYLLYRQELIDEINAFQDEGEVRAYGGVGSGQRYTDETHDQEEEIMEEDSQRTNQIRESAYIHSQSTKSAAIAVNDSVGTTGNSAYPPGCLVFVRNIHPDTNKTTLRSLFLHARETRVASGMKDGKKDDAGLDYLDYTKGMDCCHVRLRTPLHAQQLVHHLSSNPIVQTSGLDASGVSCVHLSSSSDKDDTHQKPIMAEQVLGKREEVYWQKVPEKVRRHAVEKAFSLLHSGSGCDVGMIAGPSAGGKKNRKRELEEHSVDLYIQANSAYPPSCLVFIRNVHPETNKTTLRNLFSHAWEDLESGYPDGKKDEGGIDYVDYNKGMDCCHVRLRTPLHAQQLVHYLSSNLIIQTTGLNASGSRLTRLGASSPDNRVLSSFESTSQSKPLVVEQVLGKREEVYWEKVPEKVRRQAVDKALSFLHGRGDSGGASSVVVLKGSKPSKRCKKL